MRELGTPNVDGHCHSDGVGALNHVFDYADWGLPPPPHILLIWPTAGSTGAADLALKEWRLVIMSPWQPTLFHLHSSQWIGDAATLLPNLGRKWQGLPFGVCWGLHPPVMSQSEPLSPCPMTAFDFGFNQQVRLISFDSYQVFYFKHQVRLIWFPPSSQCRYSLTPQVPRCIGLVLWLRPFLLIGSDAYSAKDLLSYVFLSESIVCLRMTWLYGKLAELIIKHYNQQLPVWQY